MSPIHLRLFAWRRLEPPHGNHVRRLALRPKPVRQDRIAAAVIPLPQFAQQHLRIPDPGLKPFPQIWFERLQFAHRNRTRPVHRPPLRLQQVLPDRLTIETGQLTDCLNAQPFSFERVDLFHVCPPEQVSTLLWFPELGLHHLPEELGNVQTALWGFLHRR